MSPSFLYFIANQITNMQWSTYYPRREIGVTSASPRANCFALCYGNGCPSVRGLYMDRSVQNDYTPESFPSLQPAQGRAKASTTFSDAAVRKITISLTRLRLVVP